MQLVELELILTAWLTVRYFSPVSPDQTWESDDKSERCEMSRGVGNGKPLADTQVDSSSVNRPADFNLSCSVISIGAEDCSASSHIHIPNE